MIFIMQGDKMANETRIKQLATLYVSIFEETPTNEQLHQYVSFNDSIALEVISSMMMMNSPQYSYYNSLDSENLVKSMFQKIFGYSDSQMNTLIQEQEFAAQNGGVNGFQYWVNEIENNPYVNEQTLPIALLNGGGTDGLNQACAVTSVTSAINNYANAFGLDINLEDGTDLIADGLYYGTYSGAMGGHVALNVYDSYVSGAWYSTYWDEGGYLSDSIDIPNPTISQNGVFSYFGTFTDDSLSGTWSDSFAETSGTFTATLVGTNDINAEEYLSNLLS
jgi:hypothetical protein